MEVTLNVLLDGSAVVCSCVLRAGSVSVAFRLRVGVGKIRRATERLAREQKGEPPRSSWSWIRRRADHGHGCVWQRRTPHSASPPVPLSAPRDQKDWPPQLAARTRSSQAPATASILLLDLSLSAGASSLLPRHGRCRRITTEPPTPVHLSSPAVARASTR
jgi:hypothetical protein